MLKSLTIRQKEVLTGLSILAIVFGGVIGGEALVRIQQLIAFGTTPAPKDLDPVELAAHTALANVLLNLDEAITRE